MLECIFLEQSEIHRKGPEKHMEVPAQHAFEFNLTPYFFGLRIHNSLTAIALAVIALVALLFLLVYCGWSRFCDVAESPHRHQGRYVYNDPSPRFKAVQFFICEIFGEMFYLNL